MKKRLLDALRAIGLSLAYDLVQLAGLALVVYGVAQWSPPAAYIVAGAGLILGSYLDARRG